MFPRITDNPAVPLFEAAKKTAANMPAPGESGSYTAEMFKSTFPQFFTNDGTYLVPETALEMFITNVNSSVLPSRWGDWWEYAAGLFVAHFCTLFLQTYADSSTNAQSVTTVGQQNGLVSSATMGDTSISYDNSAVTAATEKWGTWNSTKYGAQLATLARMLGIAGVYVI